MLGRTGQWALTAVVMLVVAAPLGTATATATATAAATYPFMNTSLSWADRVSDLVGRLTLEEMMWQMSKGGEGDIGGPAPAIQRLGIGKFRWDTECLRGVVNRNATAFPQALGLAAAFSPDLMFDVAEATAVEVRGNHNEAAKQGDISHGTGLNCFSPVVNVMRDPRWGRNQETYGEDPYLSGIYAQHFIRGLQGNNSRYVRASGGCKHFDVHGGPENIPVSRASFNAEVSEMDWRTTFLPAFKRCADAGSFGFMCSYNSINGVPSCANKKLLNDITRGEWGWDGYVISDAGAIERIVTKHRYLNNSVDTVAACVNAGCNLELSGLAVPYYYAMVDAVNQNKLTEDMVRKRVAPLFYTRMRLGEFDPPEMNPYSKFSAADILSDDHKALAVKAAMQSFVLLKNSGLLPLNNTAGAYKSFGVAGPMSDNLYMTFGDYRPNPPKQDVSTPLDALKAIAATVNFAKGCDDTHCHNYDAASVIKAVSLQNDINFVVLGTGALVEAEANDRPDTELPGQQKALLMDVIKHTPANTPIVLLLVNGGPLNISFADQDSRVSAIMECFFPAQATGEALRHVLLNDVKGAVPAGRLPFTWPLLASQIPPMVNYSMQGRTYRYYTSSEPPKVLYPFGHGLSYTTFNYTKGTHKNVTIKAGAKFTGYFWIRNIGKYEADEVSQVYISWQDHTDGQAVPKLQLAWFKRYPVPLHHPVSDWMAVVYEVEARSMAMWTPDGWVIKPGMMNLYIGGGQPHYDKNVIVDQFEIVGSAFLGKY